MNWTKKKKMQTAGAVLLALLFVAGGLTVYANGLNRKDQAIFTGADAFADKDYAAGAGAGNEADDDESRLETDPADIDKNDVIDLEQNEGSENWEAEQEENQETDEAENSEDVRMIGSDSLKKAYVSMREEPRFVDPSRPMVALTYDDGPYTAVTDRILDSLAENGGRATFFVVGNRVGNYPLTMNRITAEGHEVGNHSYTHTKFTSLSSEGMFQEINDTQYIVTLTTDVVPELFRLPYGAKNDLVMESVDMPMIQWSLDTLDWKTRDAQSTIDRVLEMVKDGDIILMHDLYDATAEASEYLIPELTARGFQLVTVSELLNSRGIEMDGHTLYYKAPLDDHTDDGNVEQEVERYQEEQK